MPLTERKKKLRDIIKNEYKGKTAKFEKEGETYYAILNSDTANKNVYGDRKSDNRGYKAKVNIGVDGDFVNLVENSTYDRSSKEQGKKTSSGIHDKVESWDYYVKTIKSDGRYYDVVANIYDTRDEQYVYDVRLNERKNKQTPIQVAQSPRENLWESAENSISQNDDSVNSSIANSSDNDTDNEIKYQINPDFSRQYDMWDKKSTGGYFKLGTTSPALESVGINPSEIYWYKNKINNIRSKHSEMTDDVIKQIPYLLEEPILIMQSNTVSNRAVVLGELIDTKNRPVMAALELKPDGNIEDFIILASAYGRNNVQNLINDSDILYVEPNTNRTDNWLQSLGLQLPARVTSYGSIGSITYTDKNVKGQIEFPAENNTKTAMQLAFEKAGYGSDSDDTTSNNISENPDNDTDMQADSESTIIDDTSKHSPSMEKIIEDYKSSVDEGLVNFINYANSNPKDDKSSYELSPPSEQLVKDVNNLLGIDISEYTNNIRADTVHHINRRHGESGKHDHTMADINDVARIDYVLNNYDTMHSDVSKSRAHHNADGSNADTVLISKKIDGRYYVVEAVPNNKSKKLQVVSAYMQKNKDQQSEHQMHKPLTHVQNGTANVDPSTQSTSDVQVPLRNVRNDSIDVDTSNIPQDTENVNSNTVKNDTDSDTQYQLAETKGLIRKSQQDKKRIKELENQLKLSKGRKTDRKKISDTAKQLIWTNNVMTDENFNIKTLTQQIFDVYNDLDNREKSDSVDIVEAINRLNNINQELIERSWYTDDPFLEDRREIRATLREKKIFIGEDLTTAIAAEYGSYENFRKKNFMRLNLTTNKQDSISVKQIYDELANLYPVYFPDNITTPNEMLFKINDVLNEIKPLKINVFQGYENEAIEELTTYIINEYFEIPQEYDVADNARGKLSEEEINRIRRRGTYETNAANKAINKLKEENKERLQNKLNRLKNRHAFEMIMAKQEFNEKLEKMDTKKRITALNTDSKKVVNRFTSMLNKPTDTRHITKSLEGVVSNMTEAITRREVSTDKNGRPVNVYELDENKIADVITALKEAVTNDSLIVVQEELREGLLILRNLTQSRNVNATKEIKSLQLQHFSLDEAQTLNNVLIGISKLNSNYNKMLSDTRSQTVREVAENVVKDNKVDKAKREMNLLVRAADSLINFDTLNPWTMFEKLGGTIYDSYLNIVAGQEKHIANLKTAEKYMKDLLGDTDITTWSGDKAKVNQFELSNGGKAVLTTAQVMSLYLLDKQEASKNHLLNELGGRGMIRSDIKKHGKQIYPTKVTQADIDKITSSLTAQQKKVADGISEFFKEHTSAWGNEISEQLLGYLKFTEENYFPIQVAKEFKNNGVQQWGVDEKENTLENAGVTKSRIKSHNPIIVDDIFSVFNKQVATMSAYNAYVIPLNDFNKVMNYQRYDGDSESVQAAIKSKYGNKALEYITNFVKDVNSAAISRNQNRSDTSLSDLFIRNYKASSVGMNLSVIAKQPVAIIRAMSMLNPKYIAQGDKGGGMKDMLEHSAIAQIKNWGFSDVGNGKNLRQLYDSNSVSKAQKLADLTMKAAGAMDDITWTGIWNGVRAETIALNPDVEVNSDQFYDIANKRFREIIGKTQVVDSVFDTSDIMKNKSQLTRMATAFMGEPLKTYNMVYSAINAFANENTKENRKRLAGAVGTSLISSVVTAAVSSIATMLRDEEDEEEIWDEKNGKTTWQQKFIKETLTNIGVDVLSMIPYARDVLTLFQGYDVERLDMAAIGNLINSFRKIQNYIVKDSVSYTPTAILKETASAAGQLLGVPVKTIWRDIESFTRNIAQWSNNEYMEYGMKKIFKNIESSSNRSDFYEILNKAYIKGDYETYYAIKADMLKHGITDDMMKTSLTKRLDEQLDELYELYANDYDSYMKNAQEHIDSGAFDEESLKKERNKRAEEQYKELYGLWFSDRAAYDKLRKTLIDDGHSESEIDKSLSKSWNADTKAAYKHIYELYQAADKTKDYTSYKAAISDAMEQFDMTKDQVLNGLTDYVDTLNKAS